MEFTRHVHSYLNDYIRLADAKAAAALVVASAMMGFLADSVGAFSVDEIDVPKTAWFSAAMSVNVLAVLATIVVIWPRLGSGNGGGLIYWRDILRFGEADNYAKTVASLTNNEAVKQVAVHNWYLAKIADVKYNRLLLAFALTGAGLIVSIPFAVVY